MSPSEPPRRARHDARSAGTLTSGPSQGHQEQWAPEHQVGDHDDDEHLDPLHALTLHALDVCADAAPVPENGAEVSAGTTEPVLDGRGDIHGVSCQGGRPIPRNIRVPWQHWVVNEQVSFRLRGRHSGNGSVNRRWLQNWGFVSGSKSGPFV